MPRLTPEQARRATPGLPTDYPRVTASLTPGYTPSPWLVGTCGGRRVAIKRELIESLTEAPSGCRVETTGQPASAWLLDETLDELLAQ